MKSGTFQLSPLVKWGDSVIAAGQISENLGFSTFFSTVVENFGGRPYGRCRKMDFNIGLLH